MHKPLTDLPVFDPETFNVKLSEWAKLLANAKPGGKRIVIEWGVGRGPSCFVYPAPNRAAGFNLASVNKAETSDERWADFLEFDFVPKVAEAVSAAGLVPQVICADLRPIQIMRLRRRAIESAARAKTGVAAH